ncbi:MAG: glutamate--tRNA ligase [Candidatus Omnitrophica bacterium]|nr:glutamate--tRNA ligase [Candidatus Omnitrophota bacterium]
MIKVRFAPSPTGYLHTGGARTALFNWLYARHNKGIFVLRIEDTDKERSEKKYLDQILEDLEWLGLDWDEGPFFQSQRIKNYLEKAQKILDEGLAYKEGQAIILRTPQKMFEFTDLIRGQIKFEAGSFKDQVLIKSDGTPTYNFACCVDDHDMGITHVIRGDDHISNTPKQLAIYEALKVEPPQFAHIPLIVAQDRSRLSKRKGARPLSDYREEGYLADALFNFLALLGWSPGDDSQVLSKEAIISGFSLERVLKSAAYFDAEKLEWMNAQHIMNADNKTLVEKLIPMFLEKKLITKDYDQRKLTRIIELCKPRVKKLSDFLEVGDFFFVSKIEYSDEAKAFLKKDEKTKKIIQDLSEALQKLDAFDVEAVEAACRGVISDLDIKPGALIHPTRVALTGKRAGPGLFELMSVLGKEEVLKRLQQSLELIQ